MNDNARISQKQNEDSAKLSPQRKPVITNSLPDENPPPDSFAHNIRPHAQIALILGSIGLAIIFISPFFKWVSIGAGGFTGIAGDGKILLVATMVFVAAYVAIWMKYPNVNAFLILLVQVWGVITTAWMLTMIWKISSVIGSEDMKGNPFAAMFSTMLLSPGTGLYLGLIGGLVLLVAMGYLFLNNQPSRYTTLFFLCAQSAGIVLGVLPTAMSSGYTPASRNNLSMSKAKQLDAIQAYLGTPFRLSNLEISPLRLEKGFLNVTDSRGDTRPRDIESFIFVFQAKNLSEGQVFTPYTLMEVKDDFGNECKDPTDGPSFISDIDVEGDESLKELGPNESAIVKLPFDPKLTTAKYYDCELRTQVSNNSEFKPWKIRLEIK